MKSVPKSKAHIAWLIYDLELTKEKGQSSERYKLKKVDEVFTEFESSLLSITTPSPGKSMNLLNCYKINSMSN